MLAHRKACPWLDHLGDGRLEIARAQFEPRRDTAAERTTAGAGEHDTVELAAVDDGNVAGRIDAARDTCVDFSERNPVRDLRGGGQARSARALNVVRRRMRMQA